MTRNHLTLTAALIVGAAQPVCAAEVFDFSYKFGVSADMVSGSISGTRNDNGTPGDLADDFVDGISVLSAAFDGSPMTGPLFISAYNNGGWVGGPGVMFFSALSNNFILANCTDIPTCTAGYADPAININYLMLRTPGQGGTAAGFYSESGANVREDPVNGLGWSLALQAPVPEPSTYALFGLGLGALWLGLRRRRSPD